MEGLYQPIKLHQKMGKASRSDVGREQGLNGVG